MRFLIALILFVCLGAGATTFTEFWVQPTGGNTNSGHTADDSATFSAVSGNWTNATLKFFKSGLNPVAGGVTNGAWAALSLTAFPTNAQYDAIVTGADDTADTITLSSLAFMGTNPGNNVGGMSIRVGGAWKGPTTNTMVNGGGFPFNFAVGTATNATAIFPRVNFKSGTTYNVASSITHATVGPLRFEGYTSTPGDGGKALIDGGATGTSYTVFNLNAVNVDLINFIFDHNGNSGTTRAIGISTSENLIRGVVVRNMYYSGFSISGAVQLEECEVYGCNAANAANEGGLRNAGAGSRFIRCYLHDNTGANASGVVNTVDGLYVNCIFESNGKDGITSSATTGVGFYGCDFYNNTSSGIDLTAGSGAYLYMENCNFIKNGTYGINSSGSALRNGEVLSCWWGTGTSTNSSGNIATLGGIFVDNINLYATDVLPWTDAPNGDFRINLTAAKSVGRGVFTQAAINSPTNTVAFPDVGAAQSPSTNAAAVSGGSYTFSQ